MTTRSNPSNELKAPLIHMGDSVMTTVDIRPSTLQESLDFDVSGDHDINKYTCKLVNKTYGCGFLAGILFQSFSLYLIGNKRSFDGERAEPSSADSILPSALPFDVYAICRHWVLMVFTFTTLVTILVQKYRMRSSRRNTNSADQASITMRNVELCFECFRFQLGIFSGSICLLSIFTFAYMSKEIPLSFLLASFGVCFVAAFFFLCLVQICVDQTCAHVSSVEIILRYDKDEEDRE